MRAMDDLRVLRRTRLISRKAARCRVMNPHESTQHERIRNIGQVPKRI